MLANSVGINIKRNHAVIYQQTESLTKDKERRSPPLYENLVGWNKYHLTKEQYEEMIKPYVKPVQPATNIQELLSLKSASRIRNAVNLLLDLSEDKKVYSRKEKKEFNYKVGFMTLTIPSDCEINDNDIHYKIFKPFIRTLKRKFDLAEYLWKAETQDNEKLHYHLTINVFIHWYFINREWCKQLENQGYYFKSTESERASTDIHSTKNVENLAAYLCGYVAKKDEWKKSTPKEILCEQKLIAKGKEPSEYYLTESPKYKKRVPEIKLWDCSLNLKKYKLTYKDANYKSPEILNEVYKCSSEQFQKDYFTIIKFDSDKREKSVTLNKIWDSYIDLIKIKDKQKKRYEIETLNCSDAEYFSTLKLTLKKKWFNLISDGIKNEEYREIKDYWKKRFRNWRKYKRVQFTNGYKKDSPKICYELYSITEKEGKEEWGAEKNKLYYALSLGDRVFI